MQAANRTTHKGAWEETIIRAGREDKKTPTARQEQEPPEGNPRVWGARSPILNRERAPQKTEVRGEQANTQRKRGT